MPKPFWKFQNVAGGRAELLLYGDISDSTWWGDEVTPKQFAEDLDKLGAVSEITVRINSGGGDVFAAQTIGNLLEQHPANVVARIDGLCASSATIVACHCDRVVAANDSTYMVHPVRLGLLGYYDATTMQQYLNALDTIKENIISLYAKKTGRDKEEVTGWMDAQVPGGVARALYQAGYIDHPYVDMNSLKCEWIENRWWIYRREFDRRDIPAHRKTLLHFEGVDYACMVYLNGHLLGEHEGMYEDFAFDMTDLLQTAEHFVLDVMILHAPDEMGQIGRTSQTSTQKSRFGYKWDFSTRLVNLGIWQDVSLILEDEAALDDLYVHSDAADGMGLLHISGTTHADGNLPLAVAVRCAKDGAEKAAATLPVQDGAFAGTLTIPSPELWYPNGLGEQPLYNVTLTLRNGETVLDERTMRQGIRHFEMFRMRTPRRVRSPIPLS